MGNGITENRVGYAVTATCVVQHHSVAIPGEDYTWLVPELETVELCQHSAAPELISHAYRQKAKLFRNRLC